MSPPHKNRSSNKAGQGPPWVWRALINRLRKLTRWVRRSSATPSRVSQSRRALLTGRLSEFILPAEHQLVTRYLTPSESDQTESSTPRSIGGISIEPIAVTALRAKPPARTIPVFRPPGAIEEAQFLTGCTRCGDCIAACPYDAIHQASDRFSSVAGTPIIEADTQACLMCEDFPCIASCEPGVLTGRVPPVMGTALVTEHLCLAYHHTTCTVCSERCPVEGAFTVTDGKPSVNEDVCTGCGVCRYVCPAPENAILLMPAFARPSLPTT